MYRKRRNDADAGPYYSKRLKSEGNVSSTSTHLEQPNSTLREHGSQRRTVLIAHDLEDDRLSVNPPYSNHTGGTRPGRLQEMERETNIMVAEQIPQAAASSMTAIGIQCDYRDPVEGTDASNVQDELLNPKKWLHTRGLLILENLAIQLLEIFTICPRNELIKESDQNESWSRKTWDRLYTLFESSCRLYELKPEEWHSFVHADDIPDPSEDRNAKLHKINLAVALYMLLQSPKSSLQALHDKFLDLFVTPGEKLSDWQVDLYVAVKVQCAVSGCEASNELPEHKFAYLFENAADGRAGVDHHDHPLLSKLYDFRGHMKNTNQQFYDKQWFGAETFEERVRRALPFLKQHVCALLGKPYVREDTDETNYTDYMRSDNQSGTAARTDHYTMRQSTNNMTEPQDYTHYRALDQEEMVRQAALAALMNQPSSIDGDYAIPITRQDTITTPAPTIETTRERNIEAERGSATPSGLSSIQEQYERAREAAAAKAAAKLKAATPNLSARKPWTQEEENALMTGLDRVQGPHWSQILAMYGPGGTVSDVLKDRNQVQLKDKARNLKLFFLKNSHEVPHYLKHVTGELKTRAPATAAKNEARQRLQDSATEDRATADAISVLAGGRSDLAYTDATRSLSGSPSVYHGLPVTLTTIIPNTEVGETNRNSHYGTHEEEEYDDEDEPDEMMADAIQQALAVTRNMGRSGDPG